MKIKNKIMAAAAVGALCATSAVPALAFENEFHGMFLTQVIASNLLNGSTGTVGVTQANLHANKTYVDQRARIQYIAKASDDLKLVTHFEIDGRWGDNSYGPSTAQASTNSRNSGLALGGDSINLETKNVYLDFNCPITGANVKAGLQGVSDAYKGIFVSNDAAGLLISKKLGSGKYTAGWFRLDDARAAGQTVGKTTRDLTLLDAAIDVSKDVKVGASYYYYNDDNSVLNGGLAGLWVGGVNAAVHMLGVNAAATMGPLTLDGFFLYQNGVIRSGAVGYHQRGFAANVGTKVKAGIGSVKANLLYTSGSNNATAGRYDSSFISAQNETSAAYMESGVFSGANSVLIFRGNGYRTSNTDQTIVADPSNKGTGIMAAFIGYDGAVGKSFFNVNTAFVSAAKEQAAGKAKYLGTEINAELGYKLYDNLKASVQGAFVFLGPQFQGTDAVKEYANSPYLARVILSYNF